MILAGRKVNDEMSKYIVNKLISLMRKKKIKIKQSRLLILGLTFKENCPDVRNSMVLKIIDLLVKKQIKIDVIDPYFKKKLHNEQEKFRISDLNSNNKYDAILAAVAHDKFKSLTKKKIINWKKKKSIIYDVKNVLPQSIIDGEL